MVAVVTVVTVTILIENNSNWYLGVENKDTHTYIPNPSTYFCKCV